MKTMKTTILKDRNLVKKKFKLVPFKKKRKGKRNNDFNSLKLEGAELIDFTSDVFLSDKLEHTENRNVDYK